jgi:branched-chain amino acid transport system substrate-binding protein
MIHQDRRWRWRIVAGAVTVMALTAAGCGSAPGSGGGSGSTGGSTGGSASGDVIKIGNIGSYTSPQSPSYIGSVATLQAWESYVNSHGGVNGHKIDLIIEDDQGNAATAVTEVRQLIQQDHVVAIVGEDSYVDSAWAPIPEAAGIPVIGGGPYDPVMETNPDFFPSGTTALPAGFGLMQLTKSIGSSVGLLYCAEAPICEQSVPLYRSFGSAVGVQLKVAQSVSASAPNYTAQCQALIDSKASAIAINDASEIAERIVDACYTQGLRARLVQPGGIVSESWLKDPAAQNVLTVSFDAPYFDTSVSGVRTMLELLKNNNLGQTPSGGAIFAYTGAQLFLAAADAVKGSVTPDSLKSALYAMKGETLDGLAPPLTYTKGSGTSVLCYFVSTIKDSAWSVPSPATGCAPQSVIDTAKKKFES